MTTDRELLRRYVQEGAEEALAEIVRRHMDLVYGTALRQLAGNSAGAEEAARAVFAAMAGKAKELARIGHLAGWLYAATRATVSHTLRAERRRQALGPKPPPARLTDEAAARGPDLPPALFDTALQALDDAEREAVLLRFIEGLSLFTIGGGPGSLEEEARRRVDHGIEKMRAVLARHGVALSAADVGLALPKQAIAAPVDFAEQVAAATFAAGAVQAGAETAAGSGTWWGSAAARGWLAAVAGLVVFGFAVQEYFSAVRSRAEAAELREERDHLRSEVTGDEDRFAELTKQTGEATKRLGELQQKLDDLAAAAKARAAQAEVPAEPKGGPQPLPAESRRHNAERLAQMKLQLAAGAPIKGAAIVMVGGKPLSRPVEFVMGRETRIEADEGSYVVKPTLRDDGSVEYVVTLQKRAADGSLATGGETAATIVQVPWSGFVVTGDQGTALAFDPDDSGP